MDPDILAQGQVAGKPTQVREAGLEYVFSRDVLIVEPMFPHVIAACVKQLVITYPKLKPFAECGAAPSPESPVDRARRIEDRITVAS